MLHLLLMELDQMDSWMDLALLAMMTMHGGEQVSAVRSILPSFVDKSIGDQVASDSGYSSKETDHQRARSRNGLAPSCCSCRLIFIRKYGCMFYKLGFEIGSR